MGDDLERYSLCEGHFRDWLHSGLTGCRFASTFAAKKPVRIDFYSPLAPILGPRCEPPKRPVRS